MPKMVDLTGRNFGRWTVQKRGPDHTPGVPAWVCVCACGNTKNLRSYTLTSGQSKSCGCYMREQSARHISTVRKTHGLSGTPTHKIWLSMISRCHKPYSSVFKHYGGRGIVVCDRWRASFQNFLDDMGERPEGRSIDRIDNSRGYEPGNCRWVTMKVQANNRRSSRFLEFNGERLTLSQWASKLGLKQQTISRRLGMRWPLPKVLSPFLHNGHGKPIS